MCDTLIALGNATSDGTVLFAKNSDREPNEPHEVVVFPAQDHRPGSPLRCTYIEIPQVAHTHAVLLAKPVWIWGAEMGANQQGVVIGNEAVFTRVPYEKGPGLTGMDLLRLGLERGETALEALKVITSLLETHGQGGNCGFNHPFYYHNSFLIGDPQNAYLLETAGREWAAQKVTDVGSISNALTIRKEWDDASPGLVAYAIQRGWCHNHQDFDFARCYSNPFYTWAGGAGYRRSCTAAALQSSKGTLTLEMVMRILRGHGPQMNPDWSPERGFVKTEVCMHAGPGPIRIDQTTGSMVSQLGTGLHTHWLTGTSAPCTSLFKPVWIEPGPIGWGGTPGLTYDGASLWWRHELLHRHILQNYPDRIDLLQPERGELEKKFIQHVQACAQGRAEGWGGITESCFQEADKAEQHWLQMLRSTSISRKYSGFYRAAWKGFNRQARIDLALANQ